jgi:hypothetical protein
MAIIKSILHESDAHHDVKTNTAYITPYSLSLYAHNYGLITASIMRNVLNSNECHRTGNGAFHCTDSIAKTESGTCFKQC